MKHLPADSVIVRILEKVVLEVVLPAADHPNEEELLTAHVGLAGVVLEDAGGAVRLADGVFEGELGVDDGVVSVDAAVQIVARRGGVDREALGFVLLKLEPSGVVPELYDFGRSDTADIHFWRTLGVTVFWTVANVFLHVAVGLGLALLLNRPGLAGRRIYRVLLVLPWAVPSYITALLWRSLFLGEDGPINSLLSTIGIPPIGWLGDHFWTNFMPNLVTNTWLGFPLRHAAQTSGWAMRRSATPAHAAYGRMAEDGARGTRASAARLATKEQSPHDPRSLAPLASSSRRYCRNVGL